MKKKIIIMLLVALLAIMFIMIGVQAQKVCISVGIFSTQEAAEQQFRQYELQFNEEITSHIQSAVDSDRGPVQMWVCK